MPAALSKALRIITYSLLTTCSLSTLASSAPINPLDEPDQWQLLSYSSIPANTVSFDDASMQIAVSGSASPIIFPLSSPTYIDEITLSVSFQGQLELGKHQQGSPKADDFMLRLGLVYEGEKRLNMFEYAVAPGWIKTLFNLAPEDTGVSYIDFKSIYSDPVIAGVDRLHPNSEYMHEHFIAAQPQENETLSLNIVPDQNKRILGIWLSCDGDNTGSTYIVNLKELSLIPRKE
ncbi:hypothetical protein M3P05_15365 [Sansalvadorimonas sp. 2012CJ34-2]|uniref:Uncharacterized protein n=1 Tax=Parendozoicomonas callyspongiae TaxID=2942213 RepID=A0ABT0PIT7_9GAMM|nr:hypothetical protein [Sansalvadorimonas sp. 2012CJ34-2]MCL6271302.1 hypothetical protein [Sansalvadorimonas sp. 2012CJ34-2]